MKTYKTIILIYLIFFSNIINAQFTNFECGTSPAESESVSSPFEGYSKPNRTDSLNGAQLDSLAIFPVLVVFVQFKNEASDPRHTWDTNSAPIYLDDLIARTKQTSSDWWNSYDEDNEILSDYFLEKSRGKLHVVSPYGAFSVVLSQQASYYASFGSNAELEINKEIWMNLNSQGVTDWRPYDRWKKVGSQYYFTDAGQADSVVDMIFKVHKSRNTGGLPNYAGYAYLALNHQSTEYTVDTAHSIKVNYGYGNIGSGLTVSFRAQLSQYITTLAHEYGHYLFSLGHSTYSSVSYGFGFDGFYSPSDMILNGYMSPTNVTFNTTNNLGDYSSRSSGTGNLLKVPIQGDEYFLLASRNKYSKWDKVMGGDSAQIDLYNDNSEYGKGLYIYHVPNGLHFPGGDISQQDMECADGLFEWEYAGQSAQQVIHDCFISGPTVWPYYNKSGVLYDNDPSTLGNSNGKGDGISFRNYRNNTYDVKWWGVGDQPTNNCNIGTDRLFTNDEEIYTRFDIGGDREDAWRPGYNSVFSPYSSPNTNTWSNQNSGIFIWYNSYSGSSPGEVANLKIYKAGVGEPISLDSALHLTPPSRPMGLKVLPCDSLPESGGYKKIKIRWLQNQEPDMKRVVSGDTVKRYKIYRSTSADLSSPPPDALAYSENQYEYVATRDFPVSASPEFTDTISSICTVPPIYGEPWYAYAVRYRVQAVDKYNDMSVLSDFANTQAWNTSSAGGEEEDNLISENSNTNIPDEFSLKQNYPNPFNPNTNIQYDLPSDNDVSIKIFDVMGREITVLVNEYKPAGRYSIGFNGANLSSGIYYYKIEAGNFTQVKKMLLLK